MIDISKKEVDVHCPKCKRATKVRLAQVVAEETINCFNCSTSIKLVDKNGSAKKAVADINKSLSEFKKAFKSLGK
ncbi:hypothetical protein MASR2M41_11150 [Flammeovirgaceae bacterium]